MIKVNKVHLKHGGKKLQEPKLIVIHAMGEFIGGSGWEKHAAQFLNKSGLSAHSLISPDSINYRLRKDTEGAYHAKGFNSNSLGIEFLVEGMHDYASFIETIKKPYLTDGQYLAGVEQVKEWIDKWPITTIVRHSDISPERKVDPGDGFPWQQFLHDVGMG